MNKWFKQAAIAADLARQFIAPNTASPVTLTTRLSIPGLATPLEFPTVVQLNRRPTLSTQTSTVTAPEGTPAGPPRNVGNAYARLADTFAAGSFDADFDLAVARHRLIDAIERIEPGLVERVIGRAPVTDA